MTKRKDSAEKAIRDIRRASRRQYSAEEKIRIVLEGLRSESNIGPRILHIFLPLPKHPFPGSRFKLHVTGKIQKSRLCHDVLAFLVVLHGLRVMPEGF